MDALGGYMVVGMLIFLASVFCFSIAEDWSWENLSLALGAAATWPLILLGFLLAAPFVAWRRYFPKPQPDADELEAQREIEKLLRETP